MTGGVLKGALPRHAREYPQTSRHFPLIILDGRLDHSNGSHLSVTKVLLLQLQAIALGQDQAIVGAILFGEMSRVEVEIRLSNNLRLRKSHLTAKHAVDRHEAEVFVLQKD